MNNYNFKLAAVSIILFSVLFFGLLLPDPCTFCSGKGTVDCISCGGAGKYTCNQCSGAGGRWETCNCDNGYVKMPDGTTQVCSYCEGQGRKWHSCYNPNCASGEVFCNFCGGSGQKTCGTCNGSGSR